MTRESWLPPGGGNLFQQIKAASVSAEQAGITLYRLSIGQPSGAPLSVARQEASRFMRFDDEKYHEYQDNGCVPNPDFARRFAQTQIGIDLAGRRLDGDYSFLPIPGIKPMLGQCIMACNFPQAKPLMVHTMTAPGYPVPETQAGYLGVSCRPLVTNPENRFLPDISQINPDDGYRHLVMCNFPHNPSGQVATLFYWRQVCEYCQRHGIRLVNDGAYLSLAFDARSAALADVAWEYPGLSFLELYSASKAIGNGTGWRVGAALGSPDFIGDLATIKGNTDSGFCAPQALGALFALEHDRLGVDDWREFYRDQVNWLVQTMVAAGFRPAVEPAAGFFTLWQLPKRAFGKDIVDAQDFNFEMIRRTGIVGVHFHPYIRYAVCGMRDDWREPVKKGFEMAEVAY